MLGDVEGGDGGVVCLSSAKLAIGKRGPPVVNLAVEARLRAPGKLRSCSLVEATAHTI